MLFINRLWRYRRTGAFLEARASCPLMATRSKDHRSSTGFAAGPSSRPKTGGMSLSRLAGMTALAAVLLLAPSGVNRAQADTVLYLAHTQQQDDPFALMPIMAAAFQRIVAQASGGTLRVEIFPNGWLGGNRDAASLVNNNIIQTAIVTAGGIAGLYPEIAVPEIPFAFDSTEIAEAVLDGPFGHRMADDIARRSHLVTLGFGDSGGFFVLTNSVRPIQTPQDVQGLKLRTIPGFGAMDAMIAALGATPIKISSREEANALASGLADGQMNTISAILAARFDDVQQYATLTSFLYAPMVWVMNEQALAALTPEQQSIVAMAARAGIQAGRQAARALEHSERGLPALHKRLTIHIASPEERAAFKAALERPAKDYITKTFGAEGTDLVDALFQAIAEAKQP